MLIKPVGVDGQALLDFGLQSYGIVDGIGLVTFGFLWPKNNIWAPCDYGITTSWAACGATISSSWMTCGAAPSTTWTDC